MSSLLYKVKKLCMRSYPRHNLQGHLLPVVDISLSLCDEHGGDKHIVEPGAYLHDIGRVRFDFMKYLGIGHEVSGYYYSRFKLAQFGCKSGLGERISRCVLEHCGSGNSDYVPTSLESEIVMNADAVSHFEQHLYLLCIRYSSNQRDLKKAKEWVQKKLKRSWDTKITLPGLKERLRPEYDRIKNELAED